ncbi:phytoene synthase [Bacillus coahuilensis m2-6]|uniref:phytoene/squalene synthase family protein n=1 Tax=Bacillus coahuilensis TaxID=408580 RepID=UPI0001850CAE|nr:phytoene/squalene synthase family protein [Bacillus coahuilensis]KUP09049.1 phytoene synthase [Bacillus coahuilensis m2-6]
MNSLSKAYQECEEVIKFHSKTFYRAFSLLPKDQKKAVWAVYAFCRIVDDIVDEHEDPVTDLYAFEEEFRLFLEGRFQDDNSMWVALSDVFNRFNMDVQAFWDMIKGQRMDINSRVYETTNDVLDYSYHVASTVGLMLLPILAPGKEKTLREGAIHLGYAMQMTNILRDVGEDLERNRIYLPRDLFTKYHYTQAELESLIKNDAFVAIWEDLARKAELYYESALLSINEYPLYSRTPVKGAALLYRAIIGQVRKNHYNVFTERNYVTAEMKNEILSMMS